jgi:hypothetical protein
MDRRFFGTLAFSPDGKALAVVSLEGILGVWDIATGKELLTYRGPSSPNSIDFSPDSKKLVVGYRDTTALIWDMTASAEPARMPPKDLSATDLDRLWADLASGDASQAYSAHWALAANPEKAVPYLKKVVQPALPVSSKEVEKLIANLDHSEFDVREAASKALAIIGAQAELELRKTLDNKPTAEARGRIETILGPPRIIRSPEILRKVRAIQTFEQIGSKDAREALSGLAGGAPAARETQEAKASLDRLAKRATLAP